MLVGVVTKTRSILSSPPLSKMCLHPCKIIIIIMWEIRKHKLHEGDSGPGHSQSSPTDQVVVEGQRNGKFGHNGTHVSK